MSEANDKKVLEPYESPEIYEIGEVADHTFGSLNNGKQDHVVFFNNNPVPC